MMAKLIFFEWTQNIIRNTTKKKKSFKEIPLKPANKPVQAKTTS